MRTALMLLALLVLGFAAEASAQVSGTTVPDMRLDRYTIEVFGQHFGVADVVIMDTGTIFYTAIYLGPFGNHRVPFTSQQWLFGFPALLAILIAVPVIIAIRWKRKRE